MDLGDGPGGDKPEADEKGEAEEHWESSFPSNLAR
jgi:hypothetical protein